MSEKPVMITLPSWNPDEPRFIVKECPQCSDDRAFKNNECVYNQRLGFAYSVDEIVEVLNNEDVEDDFNQSNCITVQKSIICDVKKENEQLKEIIKFSCVMEICESCKYGKYWITQDYWTGEKEGDFKCLKGHPAEDCCEIMECKDYELKDLDELLKEVE